MDDALRSEGAAVLAAARAWLEEVLEEGVDQVEAGDAAPGSPAAAAPGAGFPDGTPAPDAGTAGADAPGGVAAEQETARARTPQRADATAPAASPTTPATAAGSAVPGSGPTQATGVAPPDLFGGERPTLARVREALGDCQRCRLAEGRTQIVFGDGAEDADLMFVGEGPGEQEDLQGIPFCGRAGELLTRMIERGLGIPRASVYICNVVKCRPPGNRTPLADEVAACRPFLDGQIEAVRPRVIVALGKPAASLLLGRDVAITRVRGTWHEYRGVPVMPTFHPAFLLRQYTQQNRRLVWNDLRAALERARELGGRFPEPDGGEG